MRLVLQRVIWLNSTSEAPFSGAFCFCRLPLEWGTFSEREYGICRRESFSGQLNGFHMRHKDTAQSPAVRVKFPAVQKSNLRRNKARRASHPSPHRGRSAEASWSHAKWLALADQELLDYYCWFCSGGNCIGLLPTGWLPGPIGPLLGPLCG